MSSTLHNLVIEILNQAKIADDSKSKLFSLEQIKEIIFHRDSTLLPIVIPDVSDFMVERAPSIRKFLVYLFGEAARKHHPIWNKTVTLFSFIAADAPTDSVLKALEIEMAKLYNMFIRSIANLPQKSAYTASNADPKEIWNQVKSICNVLLDSITSSKNEEIRVRSIKLAEVIILFGLSKDLHNQSDKQNYDSTYNVTDISLHNSHIDRNIVQSDAETLLGKMALWARRGGPQENPFHASELSQLGSSIGRIAVERPTSRKISVLALSFLLSDMKSSNITTTIATLDSRSASRMKVDLKTTLVEVAGRVLNRIDVSSSSTSTTTSSLPADVKVSLTKLREALENVTLSASTDLASVTGPADEVEEGESRGTKRPFLSISTDENGEPSADTVLEEFPDDNVVKDDDEGIQGEFDVDREAFHDSVIAAVDSAHTYLQLQRRSGDDGNDAATSGASGSSKNDVIEFGSDLIWFPNPSVSVKLASIPPPQQLQLQQKQRAGQDMVVKYLPPETDAVYSDMSMESLHRLLEGIMDSKKKQMQIGLPGRIRLAVKLVLSLSLAEVFSLRPLTEVNLVAKAGPSHSDLPQSVPLPRPLWLFVCFALGGGGGSRALSKADKDLLTAMSDALYQASCRSDSRSSALLDTSIVDWERVYEGYCLAILSRVVQRRDLRYFNRDVLFTFPYIPLSCVRLLSNVLSNGSLPPASTTPAADRDRGTRAVGLSILATICTSGFEESDEDGFGETVSEALNSLLAAALSDDFGTRSKVISVLVEDIMARASESTRNCILTFARQSCVALLGGVLAFSELFNLESDTVRTAEESGIEGMEIEGSATKAAAVSNDFRSALTEYDDGATFGVSFMDLVEPLEREGSTGAVQEALVRRHLQLPTQLCLRHPVVLADLLIIHVVASAGSNSSSTAEQPYSTTDCGSGGQEVEAGATDAAPTATVTISEIPSTNAVVAKLVRTEILNLLPALTRHSFSKILTSMFSVPEAIKQRKEARALLVESLDILMSDPSHPPSVEVIEFVKSFVRSPELLLEASPSSSDSPAVVPVVFDTIDIRLCSSIAGGLEPDEVMALLPRLLSDASPDLTSIADPDRLRKAFNHVVQARPPPLSASELLVALHRLDHGGSGFKPKLILEAIGLCLADKQTFNAEAISEALAALLGDRPLSLFFMRTVILSAQTFTEIRKFGLSEVVPQLLKTDLWESAPRVWEGVAVFIRSYAAHKDAEPCLKSMLTLPTAQLKSIMRIASNVKLPMAKVLASLSEEEISLLSTSSGTVYDPYDPVMTGEGGKEVAEKSKLVKELLTLLTTPNPPAK